MITWLVEHFPVKFLKFLFEGHTTREVMLMEYPQIDPAMTIRKLVEEIAKNSSWHCSAVICENNFSGLITYDELNLVPIESWTSTTVGNVMSRFWELPPVTPETNLFEVLQRMAKSKVNVLPVVENGKFAGMIHRKYVFQYIQKQTSFSPSVEIR